MGVWGSPQWTSRPGHTDSLPRGPAAAMPQGLPMLPPASFSIRLQPKATCTKAPHWGLFSGKPSPSFSSPCTSCPLLTHYPLAASWEANPHSLTPIRPRGPGMGFAASFSTTPHSQSHAYNPSLPLQPTTSVLCQAASGLS